jgi:glycosyltransferase involved in cell wall biosynthesis
MNGEMPMSNIDMMNILAYVKTQFKHLTSKSNPGGWLRFQNVLMASKQENLRYYLVEFKLELQNPVICGAFLIVVSMISAFIKAIKVAKRNNVHIIMSPTEEPQAIILSYLSSKITGRRFVTFLNSVPCYGSIDVQSLKESDVKFSYKSLFRAIRNAGKLGLRAILEALAWRVVFKILDSPSTYILCLSPVVADDFSKLGVNGRIIPIYPGNGINYDEIFPMSQEIVEKKYDAIYAAGNFHPQKGIFEAVKIWENVIKKHPEFKLAIAGVVYYNRPFVIDELNALIKDLGLQNNVSIIGDPLKGMPQKELWKEMKRSKIFLYPSKKDVWPLIIGEALAYGLPAIVYDLPGIKYAYGDCPTVYLQDVGDVKGAAKMAIRLLTDYSSLKDRSRTAQQYAKNHDWNHVVKLERKAYLTVLKS